MKHAERIESTQGLPNLTRENSTEPPPNWKTAEMGGEYLTPIKRYEEPSIFYHIEKVSDPTQALHAIHKQQVSQGSNGDLHDTTGQQESTITKLSGKQVRHSSKGNKLPDHVTSQTIDWFDKQLGKN